jgi:3,4-dihydroxy-2-butanone 4-phosphate synthase
VEETSGWVCVGMRGTDLDRLQLPLLVPPPLNDEALRTAFAMPVDLAAGTTTGIDAHDRQGSGSSLLADWTVTAVGILL